jgi:hypothetical protein
MDEGGRAAAGSEKGHEDKADVRQRLSPEALRALAEAEERRFKGGPERPPEFNGRGGLDPVRYGDWEVKGLASDF